MIDTSIQLFGIKFFSGSTKQLLNVLVDQIENSSKTSYIVTPNPEQMVQAKGNTALMSVLSQADFALPDGVGIIQTAKLKAARKGSKEVFAERLTGADVGMKLLEECKKRNWSVVLVGGRDLPLPDLQNWPQLYWTEGYKNVTHPTKEEDVEVEELVVRVKPKVVMVAFGAPHQELWIAKHWGMLRDFKVPLVMVVGGAPDFWFNKVKRAPEWVRSLGFEWLFRLMVQPWRWQRQLRLLAFLRLAATEILS
jgi:N-acetylglucosaminyldiphosphoundecaprenol N-acetyl-beta-D-mannosaminyltransferase